MIWERFSNGEPPVLSAIASQFIEKEGAGLFSNRGARMIRSFRLALILGFASLPAFTLAAEEPVDFDRQVRPILQERCLSCHGPEKQKSGFRVDVKSIAIEGGDIYGPNILPGKSDESNLIHFVSGEDDLVKMPPKGPPLTADEIAILRRWVNEGANWPETSSAQVADRHDYWSFKPLTNPEPPKVALANWPRNPIDQFVLAKLEEKGLTPSPEADRRTLIRRLSLVLLGLPPTPEQVEAFVNDPDPCAYEKLVDQMLDSPRYGESWARHWLDVIAFGETSGFEVNTPRPNAWPYRDYVIEAFNNDIPQEQFIREQLAGDVSGEDRATGFLVATAANLVVGQDEESKKKARQDELNDMVATVGGAFLGLTLHCARCHDHKFDPVSQSDYYSMQAIFSGVRHGERELRPPDWEERQHELPSLRQRQLELVESLLDFEPIAQSGTPRAPVHAKKTVDRFTPVRGTKLRMTVLKTALDRTEPCIDELEIYTVGPRRRNVALASTGKESAASGTYPNAAIHRLEHVNDGRYGNERSWISNEVGKGWVEITFAQPETIDVVVWGRDRNEKYRDRLIEQYRIEVCNESGEWVLVSSSEDREAWPGEAAPPKSVADLGLSPEQKSEFEAARAELASVEARIQAVSTLPRVYAGRFEAPAPSFRLNRGDATQPREQVPPAAVKELGPELTLPTDAPEQERRLALARWLSDPRNPLPARVRVNRLWLHHFGEGIVSTPNDFGHNGAMPSHPELLDWLASEFLRSGGHIKALQRLIVTSATWRQSGSPRPEALAVDAQCRLLWRYPQRRLEAEMIRDGMLQASGTLDLRMGGPGFSVFAPNNNYVRVYNPKPEFGPSEWRRSHLHDQGASRPGFHVRRL